MCVCILLQPCFHVAGNRAWGRKESCEKDVCFSVNLCIMYYFSIFMLVCFKLTVKYGLV